jgi:hypothetical protein
MLSVSISGNELIKKAGLKQPAVKILKTPENASL